ncbi:hypothetical protein ACL02U_04215 [Streptomyces sp. MS06]|uniref:hypothetical protein n=1 Tax=Streptomyces sp. MS06 TaxID=3385974 RepID=UPI0039A1313B
MSGQQRTRVWLAAIAAAVTIAGTLVALFATDTIGGDRNECSQQSVCGHDNNTDFGDSSGRAPQSSGSPEGSR